MIKEYERPLTSAEKKILGKELELVKQQMPKRYFKILGLATALLSFTLLSLHYSNGYLFALLFIISFFIIWYLRLEISELIRIPRFIKNKSGVIAKGIVLVRCINVDRYIKIDNYEDEGNYYIIEYDNRLSMVGGQDFSGVRKLKNRIEEIKIIDSDKTGIYYETVNKYGNTIEALYVFKDKISDNFASSEIFQNLVSNESISGTLEDLRSFITEDIQNQHT